MPWCDQQTVARKLDIQQVATILPNLQECPHHPPYIVLPFHGLRACCLYEALQRIRDGEPDPVAIATAATAESNVMPLRRPKPPRSA